MPKGIFKTYVCMYVTIVKIFEVQINIMGALETTQENQYVKIVQILRFFWSVFPCIQSEYRKIRTIKNSIFGHFSRSEYLAKIEAKTKKLPLDQRWQE